MAKGRRKYSPEDLEIARGMLAQSPLPRDSLPYTPEFKELRKEFNRHSAGSWSEHGFWLLLASAGKRGGAGGKRRRLPPGPKVTKEQQLEILGLVPEYVGSRDRLPYTREFDDILRRYTAASGQRMTKHDFWRVLSRLGKRSRKPQPPLSPSGPVALSDGTVRCLEDTNPWWVGGQAPPAKRYRRWIFEPALDRLRRRLTPILAIRGPRQVGKTTVQEQVIEHLLGVDHIPPKRVLRVQFDAPLRIGSTADPILEIVRWYERRVLGEGLNAAARRGQPAFILLDELQEVRDWAPQLKFLVDHKHCHVLVTGSSALRIAEGTDSLAGRMSVLQLGPLRLWEIAGIRGRADLVPFQTGNRLSDWTEVGFWRELVAHGERHRRTALEAFAAFSQRGGYPRCHVDPKPTTEEVAELLVQQVVRRTVEHDLRRGRGGRRRDERLLEEVFRLACRYAGQAPKPGTLASELSSQLESPVTPGLVASYLRFLADAMLIRLVEPLQLRTKKQPKPAKLCLCDHAVRAAWLQEAVPLDTGALRGNEHLADVAGRLIESVIGYYLTGIPGLEVAHFPERPREPEVDFALTVGVRRIPVEVKYRRDAGRAAHTSGLHSFIGKEAYGARFGLLVTQDAGPETDRVVRVPAWTFLLVR